MLPGIAFVFGLTRLHSARKPTTVLEDHFSVGVILVVLSAIVFHWLFVLVGNPLLALLDFPRASPGTVFALLVADSKSAEAVHAIRSIDAYPIRIGLYFILLPIAAAMLGKKLNSKLKKKRSADWYDLLRPDATEVTFIWLTADVELGGSCYLFAGEVLEFSVAREGHLERVVIRGAMKRPLLLPIGPAGVFMAPGDQWSEIPGEFVVLHLSQTSTVNVDYYDVNMLSEE